MTAKQRRMKRNEAQENRRQVAAQRAFARSALYRLLSQALVYPSTDAVSALQEVDLPAATALAPALDGALTPLVEQLGRQVARSPDLLEEAYRHVFPHIETGDCPSHETAYTAHNIFQETQTLSDLAGFFRAFGLELAQRERPDHIGVELEFMYVLTYKEGYALLHHGAEQARLCRIVQRKFMEHHLGRWAPRFAVLLARGGASDHLGAAAALAQAFLDRELTQLRVKADVVSAIPVIEAPAADDFVCPLAQDFAGPAQGDDDAPP